MASTRVHTSALIIALLAIVGGAVSETFQFPEFVAIEGDGAACGGWIIDKVLRPKVLTTEGCAKREHGSLRQLLVRYGSAEIEGRTPSLAVDRKLRSPDGLNGELVVLSTFGRVRRNPPKSAPPGQRYNGTSLLCWHRTADGTLQKSLLQVAPNQTNALKDLINTLHCRDADSQTYLLEGALILQDLEPSALLTVRKRDDSSICGTSVDILEVKNSTFRSNDARNLMQEPEAENGFPLTVPNSPFGFIVFAIFTGYCILYTVMFFIFGLMRTHPSTDL